jgi:hypothetical protein
MATTPEEFALDLSRASVRAGYAAIPFGVVALVVTLVS